MNGHRHKLWLSPGAALGFVAVVCVFVLAIAFVVLPFYSDRHERATEKQRQGQARVQGQKLLHDFDCTYGSAIRLTLREAARSQGVSAHVALQALHTAQARGDKAAAKRAQASFNNATRARAEYRRLGATLKPLGKSLNGRPYPGC